MSSSSSRHGESGGVNRDNKTTSQLCHPESTKMDQIPQEIMHSLFSFDHNMENRGHLYPYNYHYGQYPYHYPYPYPHPSSAHTNNPSSSHSIPTPTAHHLAQASQSLMASQISLSPYSTAVHSIRPPVTAMREQMMVDGRLSVGEPRHPHQADLERHSVDVQHTAEDLRSIPGDTRNVEDGRYYPLDIRPVASEQRYPCELRPLTTHSRTVTDYRHVSDYSAQPTDLRTQPLDARLLGDMRQLSGNARPPLNEERGAGPESGRQTNEMQHKKEVMSRDTENYKYLGGIRSCSSHRTVGAPQPPEELQLPSGDPRTPLSETRHDTGNRSLYNTSQVSTNENRLPSNAHDPLKSLMNQHYYDPSSSLGLGKPLAMGEDVSAKSSSHDQKQQMCGALMAYGSNSQAETDPGQVSIHAQNTIYEENLQYPPVNTSNTTLGLVPHSLGQHSTFQVNGDCERQNENESCMNKCIQQLRNNGYGEKMNNGGNVPGTNGNVGTVQYEEDFDSAASSMEFSDSYMEFSDMANGASSVNAGEPPKPFQCDECKATFTTKGNLKVHKRIHTGERPYECEDCGKRFSYCASYQSHKLIHTGLRPFKCDLCERSFFRSEHLERHKRRHTGERPFKCTECDATFAASDGLSRHTRTHTGERPHHCEDCGLSFAYKSTFIKHQQIHKDGANKCEVCGLGFQDPRRLEAHWKKHSDSETELSIDSRKPKPQKSIEEDAEATQCEFCEMKFKRKSAYYFHRRSHTGEKPFACDVCGSSFVRGSYLEEHMRTHTGERPFNCDSCESAFKTRTALRFHLRTHSGERPFKCEQCDFAFTQKSAMKAHMRIHTGDKPFKCGECKAAFRHSNSLTVHKRTHTGERPFVCDSCGASFTQKSHLNLHKRSHAGIKPHMCDECNASFTKKDYLLAHKTKHSVGSTVKIEALVQAVGDSVYKCGDCEMVFTHPSSLTVHMRKHTRERPFVCAECGASFLYSSNLTTHRRKHTGERPYKCDQCEAAFILKSYLTMHLRKHSGERPFKCDECQACFTQKTHLSTHRRIHTGECPYKCEECGEAFRDGANFWRHKKKHLIGEGAATIRRRRNRKGHGRGKGRTVRRGNSNRRTNSGVRGSRSGSRRQGACVPHLPVDFDEMYEQFVLASEDQFFIKEEPGDPSSNKDDKGEEEEVPYIPIDPMVEIKLEGEDDEQQFDLEEGDMTVEEVNNSGTSATRDEEGVQ